jgi:hypothetical protein
VLTFLNNILAEVKRLNVRIRNRRKNRRVLLLSVPLAPDHDYSAVPLSPPSTDPATEAPQTLSVPGDGTQTARLGNQISSNSIESEQPQHEVC